MIVTPNRNKVLILVIVFLILANVGMAVLMVTSKNERPKGKKDQMTEYLKKELGYSDAQLTSYDSLHKAYESKLELQGEQLRNSRKERFRLLAESDFSDSAIGTASSLMATQQAEGEARMLKHLRNIRNIGSPAQREKFDSTFFLKMARKKKSRR